MLLDTNKVIKSIFALSEIEELTLMWILPVVYQYGQTGDGMVLKILLTKETAAKIVWENFNKENYSLIADYYENTQRLNNKC